MESEQIILLIIVVVFLVLAALFIFGNLGSSFINSLKDMFGGLFPGSN
ncbi:hypothetical protein GW782_00325 [bacterium]|nr:hypothetical protein [archaeon]NCS98195.1 hypothetical protein [archaeon]